MLIKYGNQLIQPFEIWYLKDIKNFCYRTLLLGKTKNFIPVVTLVEIRKSDNVPFVDNLSGDKALAVIKREKKRIDFTLNDLKKNNHSNSWIYGVNVQIKNKSGDVVQIRQYASDFDNNKKLVKKIYS